MTGKLRDKWLYSHLSKFPFQPFSVYAFQSNQFCSSNCALAYLSKYCLNVIKFCSMQHVATHPCGVVYNYITYDIPFICSCIIKYSST